MARKAGGGLEHLQPGVGDGEEAIRPPAGSTAAAGRRAQRGAPPLVAARVPARRAGREARRKPRRAVRGRGQRLGRLLLRAAGRTAAATCRPRRCGHGPACCPTLEATSRASAQRTPRPRTRRAAPAAPRRSGRRRRGRPDPRRPLPPGGAAAGTAGMTLGDRAVGRADTHDVPVGMVASRTVPDGERLQPAPDALRADLNPTLRWRPPFSITHRPRSAYYPSGARAA